MTPKEAIDIVINSKYTTKELNSKCGVYIITINNKHYVGSCKLLINKTSRDGFHYRLYAHLYNLLKGNHHSLKLQNAFNKYGIYSIEFDVLDECPSEISTDIEQYWITLLDSYKKGYNSCPFATSSRGSKWSEESKRRFSERKKGCVPWNKGLKTRPLSEETKLKLSIIGKGKKKLPMSEEQKERIKNTLKGRKITEEQRQNYLKAKESQKRENHWAAKKVYQYDLSGNFIKEWNYIKEVEKENLKHKQVYSCLRGKNKTASGYRWFYEFLGDKIDPLVVRKNQFNKYLLTLS